MCAGGGEGEHEPLHPVLVLLHPSCLMSRDSVKSSFATKEAKTLRSKPTRW